MTQANSDKYSLRRKELEEYSAIINNIRETAGATLTATLAADLQAFDINMSSEEWNELRARLIDDLYQARTYYSDIAGLAACELYDSLIASRSIAVNSASMPAQVEFIACEKTVRSLAGLLFEGNAQKFVEQVAENAENGVASFANETIMFNAKRDRSKGVMYARVPVGGETCAFCIMLASRGFDYYSEKSAEGNKHVHPHCDCRVIPGFKGDEVEGYDQKRYEDIYDQGNKGKGANDTLNNIRRNLYPERKDHINEQKRALYAKNKQRDAQ